MNHPDPHNLEDEIKRIREALDEQTRRCSELQRQLDGASADFEEFVSRMAHSLRESLRDVAAFGQLLAETHPARLDSDAAVFLARIQAGAGNIQSILTDVVDYSTVMAGGVEQSPTDMEAVLGQAILRGARQIEQRGAIITHDSLPAVHGDFARLTSVLHHLISNAIEYCTAPYPLIHISSALVDPEWVISVRDNGPGIDPAFHDQIFKTFRRLHGPESPGSGLGLAYCRKAIERLGGRIWVESAPGAGSTFYIALTPSVR